MSKRRSNNFLDALLVALGITSVGLFFRLHQFLWRIWVVLSGLWVLALVLMGSMESMRADDGRLVIEWPIYWIIIIGPPILLLVLVMLLAWIIGGLSDE